MDINCLICGEFWEVYYMCYDELYEWGLLVLELKDILDIGCFSGLNDCICEVVCVVGWEFVMDLVLFFICCLCCVKVMLLCDVLVCKECIMVLVELLDGDEDVLVSYLVE